MNQYIIPIHCAICGGRAIASIKEYSWNSPYRDKFVHDNPNICIRILADKKKIAEADSK